MPCVKPFRPCLLIRAFTRHCRITVLTSRPVLRRFGMISKKLEREREFAGLWPEQEDDLDETALPSEPEHPKRVRIGRAIVFGLQAAAWWLKRKKDRSPCSRLWAWRW